MFYLANFKAVPIFIISRFFTAHILHAVLSSEYKVHSIGIEFIHPLSDISVFNSRSHRDGPQRAWSGHSAPAGAIHCRLSDLLHGTRAG
jgi:hypothetical protein